MTDQTLKDRSNEDRPRSADEAAMLEMACRAGEDAYRRIRDRHVDNLQPGHYVVLDPSTLDYAIAPTQTEALERFARAFPNARGSLHRVDEDR
jgi:hypothetical protein